MIDDDSNDMHSPLSADLLFAAQMLEDVGRVRVQANVSIEILPQSANDEGAPVLPFSFHLAISIFLKIPQSLQPISIGKRQLKKTLYALEDAQRRILRAACLPDDVVSDVVNEPVTVSTFYSIMEPAAPLPSAAAVKAMQPEFLQPTLLPFQTRSVAWLLEREGKAVTETGEIVPRKAPEFSFWQEFQADGRTLYFNRLSGEVIDSKPESPVIYGGMLAEEPGLGKTVETIALILLNPATQDRRVTKWDEVVRLKVKPVKSTLIVTPPALAPQWKAEFEKHAPSLKVLIYDGWTKVRVPITKTERELARFAKLEAQSKAKERKKATALLAKSKSKAKTTKGKGKKKQSSADEDVDMEEEMMEEGSMSRSDAGEILEWCDYVHQFDVVITTYPTLRAEIHVARPPPERMVREDGTYYAPDRIRSPLVMVEWKRVVMDEVQMVGGGNAAEMVSLIPRLSSLAVSGTPAKSQMSDLIHVLKFLRIDQLVGGRRLWSRLLKPGFSQEFGSFLKHYGIRTIKSNVTAELTIPQQTRYLVPIELGKVERHVYDQNLEAVLLQLGLDARGVAATSGWEVDAAVLRSAIRRLRGICTHPQVGQLLRKGDNLFRPGALKTIDAVLHAMQDQNWKNLMEDWKEKIRLLIKHAQLEQQNEAVPNRYQNALRTLLAAETESKKLIEEIKDVLARHDAKGKVLIEEAARLRAERQAKVPEREPVDNGKGKGKARAVDEDNDESEDEDESERGDEGGEEDPEEKGLPKTPAGEEHRTKRRALKQRLRDGHITLHRVKFLQGDVHHVLGNSEQEDAAYQAAEQLRRDLLKATEDDANKAVAILQANGITKRLSLEELTIEMPFFGKGGIRSSHLMEEVNTIIEDVLNEETSLMWKWRTHVMGILTKALNPGGDEEVDGQEYQRTLDDQGEAETYLQAYSALLADRREALVNERTLLAAHDVREKQVRQTRAAQKAAAAAADAELDMAGVDGFDIQPEHEVLHKELSATRKELLLRLQGRSVKSVLVDLSTASVKITKEDDPEKIILKEAIERTRRLMADQNLVHTKLEADLVLLRKAFNQRILYFRQLQEISDSVAEVEWEETTLDGAIQVCVTEKAALDARINTTRARQRYLDNLSEDKDKGQSSEEDTNCILCRHDFVRGFITQCAHIFCEECMKAWLTRREGKTCPVCRVAINPDTVQRFTVQSLQAVKAEPPPQPISGEPAPQSRRQIVYNTIDPNVFDDIQTMETYGDYGSKIQTLIRHLCHLRLTDPGAKSIIFSAWADSLHIVERALNENGIQSLRIDQGTKSTAEKFTSDPDILVLLLHGERENAGLNVTCASRVFLLESVVQHSFEIQAIARIDRLGQTRPTEVYCYYAEDTVERNILDLAARKGLSLYTKENSCGTVSVSPFAKETEIIIDDPQKKKSLQRGDFIYKVDDMLAILFPHMFEDLEYLLPPTAVAYPTMDNDVEMQDATGPQTSTARTAQSSHVNAVAGPSRLS
ncbi:hypothetical protein CPC08DRAFT_682833 [Agrocybe pediades]|nr:hypothetical protein CPC08DRAFT_682833 [Agrocybe pediades]